MEYYDSAHSPESVVGSSPPRPAPAPAAAAPPPPADPAMLLLAHTAQLEYEYLGTCRRDIIDQLVNIVSESAELALDACLRPALDDLGVGPAHDRSAEQGLFALSSAMNVIEDRRGDFYEMYLTHFAFEVPETIAAQMPLPSQLALAEGCEMTEDELDAEIALLDAETAQLEARAAAIRRILPDAAHARSVAERRVRVVDAHAHYLEAADRILEGVEQALHVSDPEAAAQYIQTELAAAATAVPDLVPPPTQPTAAHHAWAAAEVQRILGPQPPGVTASVSGQELAELLADARPGAARGA
ncbi:hypothetical protein H9P43_001903 [Blastocladiella emersonii ATCC 22665]|nr:hypothetical protein H9P43_001903 [Blastocladiella emersonii ATCC 22665]